MDYHGGYRGNMTSLGADKKKYDKTGLDKVLFHMVIQDKSTGTANYENVVFFSNLNKEITFYLMILHQIQQNFPFLLRFLMVFTFWLKKGPSH